METDVSMTLLGLDLFFLLTAGIFAIVVLLYVTGVFIIAQARSDNGVMDIFYGPAFAVATWVTIWLTDTLGALTLLFAGAVTLWAVRLGVRIGRKNFGQPEDARYAAWRNEWSKKGHFYFLWRSYLQINVLQGLIIIVVSLPIILAITTLTQNPDTATPLITYIGFVVFLLGLGYESVADWQLDRFIARKKAGTETKNLMTSGLFRYSRRPNYFGEATLWWGLALAASPFSYGFLALLSPLLITFILTGVTGPMLEELFLEKYPEAYRAYMERTSYFIPLPPNKPAEDSLHA